MNTSKNMGKRPAPERIDLLAEARSTVKKLLDRVSMVALILGGISTASSVYRIRSMGWHPNIITDIIFFPVVILTILLRNRFRETAVLAVLVGITTVQALLNFIMLGVVHVGFVIMATCAIITLTVFGRKYGFLYLAGSICAVLLILLGHTFNVFPDVVLGSGYLDSPNTWFMQITTYLVFAIIMLVTVDNIQIRLAGVLNRQVRQAAELEEREEKYRVLTENMSDMVFTRDMDRNLTYCSPSVYAMMGYTPEEFLGKRAEDLMTPESLALIKEKYGTAVARNLAGEKTEPPALDIEYRRKDGTTFIGDCRPTFIRNPDGSPAGMQIAVTDITGRKDTEHALQSALKEKDVLLRELHHRTKNNMQVIHSMLSLQSSGTRDPGARSLFKDIQGRIQAMALVHRMLYTGDSFSSINLSAYVRELYTLLGRSYYDHAAHTVLDLHIDDLPVAIDTALPCGLILNELFTNTFKYAFPDDRAGRVTITARRDSGGEITLEYADNGVGLPEGFDVRATETLGMQVMHGIVEHQLQGSIECDGTDGMRCIIRFTDSVG